VHVNGQDDSELPLMNINTVTPTPKLQPTCHPYITMGYKNPLLKDDDKTLHKCRVY